MTRAFWILLIIMLLLLLALLTLASWIVRYTEGGMIRDIAIIIIAVAAIIEFILRFKK